MSTMKPHGEDHTTAPHSGWALIGFGRIAVSHVDALAQTPHRTLVAIVETDPGRAAKAQELGVPVFDTISGMLRETVIGQAIVCTPPHLHPEQVAELLGHKVHTLVEKPLALTRSLAQHLLDQANTAGCVLHTAAKFAVTESIQTAGRLIQEGRIGDVVTIENIFSGPLDVRTDWRSAPEQAGGGVLFDNGPHVVDVVRTLAGQPTAIRILNVGYKQGTAVEDEVEFELRTGSGLVAHSILSWNEAKPAPIARVVGTKATLVVGWQRLEYVEGDSVEVLGGGYDKRAAFVRIHDEFADAVAQHTPNPSYPVSGVALMEAGIRSMSSRQWESVA